MDAQLEANIRAYQVKFHAETGVEIDFATATRALIEKGLKSE